MSADRGLVPLAGGMSDEALASALAERAGLLLLDVRREPGAPTGRALGVAGDARAQEMLMRELVLARPRDAIRSEEAADQAARLSAARVWIIDPLDGTREYSEGRADWAVHVALWSGDATTGSELVGAVAIPGDGLVLSSATTTPADLPARPDGPDGPGGPPGPIRLAVSRSHLSAEVEAVAAELEAELVPMGSAGVKVASVVRGIADAYVHTGGQYEWDSAAPVAVARAAGLHTSRADGSALVYNRDNPWLPDVVVARPELAGQVLAAVRRVGQLSTS